MTKLLYLLASLCSSFAAKLEKRGADIQLGVVRDPRFNAMSRAFRKEEGNDFCRFCLTTENLEVHHVVPVNKDKSLELQKSNLMTLCHDCHLKTAHLRSYLSYNTTIRSDALYFSEKIRTRP